MTDAATGGRADRRLPVDVVFRYAVVDLAIAEDLRPVVSRLLPSVCVSLLSPRAPRRVWMVGPWLVRVSRAPGIPEALTALPADTPWGYFVHSGVDIQSLRQSLRRFNLVSVPGAVRPVMFRYWDPRVIAVFLNVADRDQRARLFEWIERIEDPGGRFDAWPATARNTQST